MKTSEIKNRMLASSWILICFLLSSPGFGTPTFTASTLYNIGDGPKRAAVGDFDGDSYLDFAVTNAQDETVSVFVNDGAGVFAEEPSSPFAVPGAFDLVAGQFNRDEDDNTDLAIIGAGNVRLYTGTGTGTFTLSHTVVTGAALVRLIRRDDLPNDGTADLRV
ncbi:MAG: FG-GAP-like repeat-containing protein, partial [bacterium]